MPTKPTGRPRGRPAGALNKPKDIESFVLHALSHPIPAPSRKASGAPKTGVRPTCGQTPGKPRDLTNVQWAEVLEIAASDANRIIKKMKDAGQLPDDPRAVEALEETVKTLREAASPKDKIAAARLILDFTKAKPAHKIDATIRTHEDFLDELAGDLGPA